MAAVSSVSSMHKKMHERAGEKRQPNEDAQNVGAMLREQKRAGNDEKAD